MMVLQKIPSKKILLISLYVVITALTIFIPIVLFIYEYQTDHFISAIEIPIHRELKWIKNDNSIGTFYNQPLKIPQGVLIFLHNGAIKPAPINLFRQNDFNANRLMVGHDKLPTDLLRQVRKFELFNNNYIRIDSLQIPEEKPIALLLYAENPTKDVIDCECTSLKTHKTTVKKPFIISSLQATIFTSISFIIGGVIFSTLSLIVYTIYHQE